MNEENRPSGESRADWVARVSHDLKNPLTGITMALEMARAEAAGLDQAAGARIVALLERATRGAARLETVLDDLVDETGSAEE